MARSILAIETLGPCSDTSASSCGGSVNKTVALPSPTSVSQSCGDPSNYVQCSCPNCGAAEKYGFPKCCQKYVDCTAQPVEADDNDEESNFYDYSQDAYKYVTAVRNGRFSYTKKNHSLVSSIR